MDDEPFRLAAIVFDRDEDPDAPLAEFLDALGRRGLRVAGLVQEHGDGEHDISVRNLTTGERFGVMQDLGKAAEGCRVDPVAVAVAARQLADALRGRPDLVVANRFGRLESEGGGLIAEIGEAVVEGIALIVCVPQRYLEAWNAFAGGLDRQLSPGREALEGWWASLASAA